MRLWSKFRIQIKNGEKQGFEDKDDFENDSKLDSTDNFSDNNDFSTENKSGDIKEKQQINISNENGLNSVDVNDVFGKNGKVRNITDEVDNFDFSFEDVSFNDTSDVENINQNVIDNESPANSGGFSEEQDIIEKATEKSDGNSDDLEAIISSAKNDSSSRNTNDISENNVSTEEVVNNDITEENSGNIYDTTSDDIDNNVSGETVQDVISNEESYDNFELVMNEEDTTSNEFLNELEKNIDSSPENIEKLQNLKDKLEKYTDKKEKSDVDKKSFEQLENNSNLELLEQLAEIKPYFERESGDGFSINLTGEEVSDSLIRTLVTKFLNQRFYSSSDLNIRSSSLERANGFYRWDLVQIVKHLETEQVTKIPYDKFGYKYAEGKHENIPLSFYFDMSGSMSNYSNLLAVISFELLKRNVKVLAGFNEKVRFQFDSINKDVSIKEFADDIKNAGTYFYGDYHNRKIKKQIINENIDSYLIKRKAEKCVVFADFDPLYEIIKLSKNTDVYWFCFEKDIIKKDFTEFSGFLYQVKDEKDIASGLSKVSEYRFQTLCNLSSREYQKRK